MNKKILILVGKITDEKERLRKLIGGFVDSNIEVKLDTFSNLTFEIESGKVFVKVSGQDIREFNLVYIRAVDRLLSFTVGTLAYCLDYFKIKYFNTRFRNVRAVNDKLTSLIILSLNGLPTAPTFFCGREKIESNIDYLVKKIGYPIVVKEIATHQTKGIFVMRRKDDFQKLLNRKNKKRVEQFLFQKYIPIEKEYRLLVLGDSVAVAHKKDKRNYNNLIVTYEQPNLETEFVDVKEIPNSLRAIAVKAAKTLGTEIAGVDVCQVVKDKNPIVIEVNSAPGVEYDTDKSPEIGEVAKFLKKNLDEK